MNRTTAFATLLGVSLVLNGFMAGTLLSRSPMLPPPPPPHSPLDRMEAALPLLSPEQQSVVQEILEKHRIAFEQHRENMRDKIEHIQAALTAPKFDEKALLQALEQGPSRDKMKDNMKGLLIEIARTLPDEERITFFRETAPPPPPASDRKRPAPPARDDAANK